MQRAKKRNVAEKKAKKPTQKAERASRALEPIEHPGQHFTHRHHVFVGKVKGGELWALNQLSNLSKASVTPLFEMWPPNPGTPTKPAKTIAVHTTDVMTSLRNEWGVLPFFLDTRYMPLGGTPSPAQASSVFQIARGLALNSVPVTSLAASQAYQQAMRNIIYDDGRGIMLRLTTQDFASVSLLPAYINGLLNVLDVGPEKVDIALDLEYRANELEVQQLGHALISTLPNLNSWRTVTLVAGCYPATSPAQSGQWTIVPRVDWSGWLQVANTQRSAGLRVPTYGDYGVRCGGPPVVIPNTPDPNLRYTDPQNILVRKGPKTNGSLQALCASLVARSEFAGSAFSVGDSLIAAKAAMQGLQSNGQPSQWIQWCTNHHLELVASEIRSLP